MRQGIAVVHIIYQLMLTRSSKVHLLALHTTDTQSLYFYTARISAAFLNRFDHPHQYIPSDQLRIFYRCIPLERTVDLIHAMSQIITTVRDNH